MPGILSEGLFYCCLSKRSLCWLFLVTLVLDIDIADLGFLLKLTILSCKSDVIKVLLPCCYLSVFLRYRHRHLDQEVIAVSSVNTIVCRKTNVYKEAHTGLLLVRNASTVGVSLGLFFDPIGRPRFLGGTCASTRPPALAVVTAAFAFSDSFLARAPFPPSRGRSWSTCARFLPTIVVRKRVLRGLDYPYVESLCGINFFCQGRMRSYTRMQTRTSCILLHLSPFLREMPVNEEVVAW